MTEEKRILDRPHIEKTLRNAGLSCRQAKKLLSGGWKEVVGDEQARQEEEMAKLREEKEQLKELAVIFEKFTKNTYN